MGEKHPPTHEELSKIEEERIRMILDYCESDVVALRKLLDALPYSNVKLDLLRDCFRPRRALGTPNFMTAFDAEEE